MTRVVLMGAVILLAATGCQASPSSDEPSTGSTGESTPGVSVLELKVGTCLNDVDQPLAQDLTEIPSVPCDQPHQSEVFAEVVLDDGEYPGVDAVTAAAQDACMVEFEQFVGLDFAASGLNYHYYYPTASSWAVGDRAVYCVVFEPGVETVGTLRGVSR